MADPGGVECLFKDREGEKEEEEKEEGETDGAEEVSIMIIVDMGV